MLPRAGSALHGLTTHEGLGLDRVVRSSEEQHSRDPSPKRAEVVGRPKAISMDPFPSPPRGGLFGRMRGLSGARATSSRASDIPSMSDRRTDEEGSGGALNHPGTPPFASGYAASMVSRLRSISGAGDRGSGEERRRLSQGDEGGGHGPPPGMRNMVSVVMEEKEGDMTELSARPGATLTREETTPSFTSNTVAAWI